MNIYDKSVRRIGEHTRWTFRRAKGLLLTAAVFVVFTIFIAASQTSSAAFPLWVESSLIRVGKTDAPGTASSISLSSARGETVDTQVVVQAPAGGLSNVNLSASALTGPGGATIPASSVSLYREYYITVTGTANYGGGSNPPLVRPSVRARTNPTGSIFLSRTELQTVRQELIPALSRLPPIRAM